MVEEKIKKILIENEVLDEKEFKKYRDTAREKNKDTLSYLIDKKILSPSPFYKLVAQYFKLPFIDLQELNIEGKILSSIPEKTASVHKIIAFEADDKTIKLATVNPDQLEIFEFIKKKTGLKPEIYVTTPKNISNQLKNYHKKLKNEFNFFQKEKDGTDNSDAEGLRRKGEEVSTINLVNKLLEHAIFQEASDIHIEPEENKTIVRYRVDGILHNVMTLPKSTHNGIVARIKILSNLKIDEHRMPQDGRFKIYNKKYKISFRVSIIPTFNGEKIVLRLLNEQAGILTLEELGFQKKALDKIKRSIKKPHGEILVTGPTGSGKTTTLYTILNILNTPEVNISTIEDPIEYHMERINQSQIQPKIGYTFALGLRAFLRQDPDIIMVGEIRDEETAQIATHAAMTGHLVLSTLHTNDTISTIFRLSNMGIPFYLISNTVNIIIAQGLVRKICPNCIQSYNLTKEVGEELEKQFDTKAIIKKMQEEGIISEDQKSLKDLLFYKGKGCKQCKHTGYKGRIGIYEILENTEGLSSLILKQAGEKELKEQAKADGLITMPEDAFIKARNGITTIDEIMRISKR
ncbi:Flp pilus assembly complex ATPase component TadA [bacterium]|nr:Flp pilus assembly complex ATPase component TadA [bacterium]